jgi:hypothetical protein
MRRTIRVMAALVAVAVAGAVGAAGGVAWANHQFSDVPNGSPFHADVDWVKDHNIMSGFPNGTFQPTNPVLRQQAARALRNLTAQTTWQVQPSPDFGAGISFPVTASCDAGDRAIAGGGFTEHISDIWVAESTPGLTSWTTRFEVDNGVAIDPDAGAFTAWVTCVPGF